MSIRLRIWLPVAVIFSLLLVFGGSVYFAFSQQSEYRKVEADTSETFRLSNRLLSHLKDAETGQRGLLLTGEERYLKPYELARSQMTETRDSLHNYAKSDPMLAQQMMRYDRIVDDKMAELAETIDLYRAKGFDEAMKEVRTDRGQGLMEQARAVAAEITDREKVLLADATVKEDNLDNGIKGLIIFGGPAITALALLAFHLATRRVVHAIRGLEQGVLKLGNGNEVVTFEFPGNDEFSRLAASFNGMAARLSAARFAQDRAEHQLRENNEHLTARSQQLELRTRSLDLLGRIAHRLPGCSNETEFGALIERYVPQLFPGIRGALYLLNPSHTLLRAMAKWNDPPAGADEFSPSDCWSLRRGQQHINLDFSHEVVCGHVDSSKTDAYMCWPLVAQNETVGLLYLEHAADGPFVIDDRSQQDINVLCETIALALVNLRLRETLRNQSIRDSMTGLFNRRYLEESLELEFSRAERNSNPIAIIMIDVDHFKQFNDTFGHAAGDLVLKRVGQTINNSIRKGDVACRYGGEEFMLVLVGATIEAARWRAEQVRNAVKGLTLEYNGRALGSVTVSLGIATFPLAGTMPASVIAAADAALYDAKGRGRDQVREAPGSRKSEAVTPDSREYDLPQEEPVAAGKA
jgi:diguanylate cyclase (GGDEF)-like protein